MNHYIFLGDVVIVKHLEQQSLKSSLIHIPETVANNKLGGVPAVVVAIGSKFRHKEYIQVGDWVIVPYQFGTRNMLKDSPDAIVYDGEDILARLS
jgi:co-chaperonin GroES (HSP10)